MTFTVPYIKCITFVFEVHFFCRQKLEKRIEGCIKSGDVVVFMKGVPEAPRCGFSNAVCQILRMHDVTFKSFDVLADEQLRAGETIKKLFFT